MSGSATFTIVMSSSSMKTPVHTAIRVHHLLAIVDPNLTANRQLLNLYVMYGKPAMDETARQAAMADLYAQPGHLLWRAAARVDARGRPAAARQRRPACVRRAGRAWRTTSRSRSAASRPASGVSGTTLTAVAHTLQADGLVERVRNPEDRRSYSLTRTPAGRAAVRRWEPHVRTARAAADRALHRRRGARGCASCCSPWPATTSTSARRRPLLDSTGFLVAKAHQRMHREFAAALQPLGIEPRHFGTLRALRVGRPGHPGRPRPPCSTSAPRPSYRWSTTSSGGAWCRGERDAADRRAYRLHLSAEAEHVVEQATAIVGAIFDGRLGGPGGRDRRDLVAAAPAAAHRHRPTPEPRARFRRVRGPHAKLSRRPALVAQRIEHLTTDQKVGGSNPSERAASKPRSLPPVTWAFVFPERVATRFPDHGPMAQTEPRQLNVGARLIAAASAVVWGLLFFGVIDLLVAVEHTPGFYESYLLETGWGLLYTFLVALPLVCLTFSPRLSLPVTQVALVGGAVAVTAVASGSWGQLVPAGLLVLDAALITLLVRGQVRPRRGWRRPTFDPVVAALGAVLAVPAVVYAVDMVAGYRDGRPPTDDDTWGIDHWPMQAALALAVIAVAFAVAAGVRSRRTGTLVAASSVTLTAAWFGIACMVYPDHAGSVGRAWGALVTGWAVTFALATLWRARSNEPRPRRDGARRVGLVDEV